MDLSDSAHLRATGDSDIGLKADKRSNPVIKAFRNLPYFARDNSADFMYTLCICYTRYNMFSIIIQNNSKRNKLGNGDF